MEPEEVRALDALAPELHRKYYAARSESADEVVALLAPIDWYPDVVRVLAVPVIRRADVAEIRFSTDRSDLDESAWDGLTELERLQLELHQERMASLRRAHRAVGGVVHHLDGDPMNNDPANLVTVDPADHARTP